MPPLIPKRRNRRLKWAFTVRSAMLRSRAISELSHPCKSSSMICCSRGPIWLIVSSIVLHLSDEALVAVQWPKQEPAHVVSRVFAYKNVHEFDHSGAKPLTKCEIS